MALPTNDLIPEEIEDVLQEYEGLLGDKTGVEGMFDPDINSYVDKVISEVQDMRNNEPIHNN